MPLAKSVDKSSIHNADFKDEDSTGHKPKSKTAILRQHPIMEARVASPSDSAQPNKVPLSTKSPSQRVLQSLSSGGSNREGKGAGLIQWVRCI